MGAAQASISSTPPKVSQKKEISCLAQAMITEAGGEGAVGQVAVAMVVINRLKKDDNGDYPNSICRIIAQPGQFPWYRKRGGKINPPSHFIEKAENIYDIYYKDDKLPCSKVKPVENAMYFNTVKIPGTQIVAKIGGHVFSK